MEVKTRSWNSCQHTNKFGNVNMLFCFGVFCATTGQNIEFFVFHLKECNLYLYLGNVIEGLQKYKKTRGKKKTFLKVLRFIWSGKLTQKKNANW